MQSLSLPATVKTYPTINVAFLRTSPAVGACWYLYRAADVAGSGWLALAAIRELQEQYRTWRSVRYLHGRGVALGVWNIHQDRILRLQGLATAAAALQVDRLTGRPVAIPVEALVGGVQLVRAHFYASYESGRAGDGPVSREALEVATGVPPRTQRLYDALLGRDERTNIVVTGLPWAPEHVQEATWQHGHVFPFTDFDGRRGPAGQKYIAYNLPASRAPVHQQAASGRQKKVNAELVNKLAQVPGVDFVRYHESAASASAAMRKQPDAAHFLLEGSDAGANIWSLVR